MVRRTLAFSLKLDLVPFHTKIVFPVSRTNESPDGFGNQQQVHEFNIINFGSGKQDLDSMIWRSPPQASPGPSSFLCTG